MPRKPENSWSFWIWDHFQRNGTYGVFCFFVVSGFLITRVIAKNQGGLGKPSFRQFYVQRAGRILPLLSLSLWIGILMLLIPRSLNSSSLDVFRPANGFLGSGFWICIFTFTFNWFQAFNPLVHYGLHFGVLWSLSVEEQFYFLFPHVLRKLGNTKNLCFFCFLVVLGGLLWRWGSYLFHSSSFFQVCPSPSAFDNIAVGILLYLAVERLEFFLLKNKNLSRLLCFVGFVTLLGIYFGTDRLSPWDRIYAPTALDLGLFTFLLGGLHLPLFKSLFWKPFGWPGKYCYGGYLLHPMVLAILFPVIFRRDAWTSYALFMAVTVALAAISYHFLKCPRIGLSGKNF